MSKTFEDRVEEVLGELHGMAWPLLEENEKRRIIGIIDRGIETYGDSMSDWARGLGVSRQLLSNRLQRFRRSEPIDDAARLHNTVNRQIRGAKAVLRDPELTAEVLKDPAIRAAAQEALETSRETTADYERQVQRDLGTSAHRLFAALDAATSTIRRALPFAQDARLGSRQAEQLEERLGRLQAGIDLIRQAATSGDWDDELAELLDSGR